LGNILIKSDVHMKLVSLMHLCLNETCSRARVCKGLSDMFKIKNGLKQGDALSPLFFNFALEYTVRMFQVNQDGLKLKSVRQFLVYDDVVIIWDGRVKL